MNLNSKNIPGILPNLLASLRGKSLTQKHACFEPPLRAELFSAAQMEQHGKNLAAAHILGAEHTPEQLLTRLGENEIVLHKTIQ